jgi:hypothetical protein
MQRLAPLNVSRDSGWGLVSSSTRNKITWREQQCSQVLLYRLETDRPALSRGWSVVSSKGVLSSAQAKGYSGNPKLYSTPPAAIATNCFPSTA